MVVTLEQEINYMKTYIEFQKQRMSDCFKLQLDLNGQAKEMKIHPLLFRTLCVKPLFFFVKHELNK